MKTKELVKQTVLNIDLWHKLDGYSKNTILKKLNDSKLDNEIIEKAIKIYYK